MLCGRLRKSNIDGAQGSVEELKRIVAQLRAAWPKVRIIIHGDSGFCRKRGFEPAGVADLPEARRAAYNARRNSKVCVKTLAGAA